MCYFSNSCGFTDTIDLGLKITHMQPGNNWKVAATLNATDHNMTVLDTDGKTLIKGGEPLPEREQTPLLTAWRHLYAEIDSMDVPVLDNGPGR